MTYIIPIIILIALILGYRLYRIKLYVGSLESLEDIKLKMPLRFFIEQAIGLFVLGIFLFALNPVPAIYAVLAVFGVILDNILTILYYSAKYSQNTELVKPKTSNSNS